MTRKLTLNAGSPGGTTGGRNAAVYWDRAPNARSVPRCGRSEPRYIGRLPAEGDVVARQPPAAAARARLLAVGIRLGQLGLRQRMQLFVGGRNRLDEGGCAIGAAPVHPVQHQAVQGLA